MDEKFDGATISKLYHFAQLIAILMCDPDFVTVSSGKIRNKITRDAVEKFILRTRNFVLKFLKNCKIGRRIQLFRRRHGMVADPHMCSKKS